MQILSNNFSLFLSILTVFYPPFSAQTSPLPLFSFSLGFGLLNLFGRFRIEWACGGGGGGLGNADISKFVALHCEKRTSVQKLNVGSWSNFPLRIVSQLEISAGSLWFKFKCIFCQYIASLFPRGAFSSEDSTCNPIGPHLR